MAQKKKSDGSQAGFTLIELLVVMVIMGLLVALVGPNLLGQVDKAKPKTARTQIENFATGKPIITMTTKSSINVKPAWHRRRSLTVAKPALR